MNKIDVNVTAESNEITIRQGDALPALPYRSIFITGTLQAPAQFLEGKKTILELRTMYKDYKNPDTGFMYSASASFITLWQSINGPDSWDLNPWVWRIETEILSTTGRPKDL